MVGARGFIGVTGREWVRYQTNTVIGQVCQ